MRLIDADLIPYLYPVDDDGNEGDGMTLQSTVDEVPTVKAIPIEVVEQILSEISEEIGTKQWENYDYCSGLIRAKNIINKAIKEEN